MPPTIQTAVATLQTALRAVHERTLFEGLGMTLIKAEVELDLEASAAGTVGVEFKLFGLGGSASGSAGSNRKSSVKMELTPPPPVKLATRLLQPPSDALADAIIALAKDAKAVRDQVGGAFTLGDFSLTLTFGFTKTGKVALIAGTDVSDTNANAITVTFKLD